MVYEPPSVEVDRPLRSGNRWNWIWGALVAVLCGGASLAVLYSVAGRHPVMPDEHQFITPGILTVRDGLIPYRDYPLFHVPYMALLNGWFIQLTGGNIHLGCRVTGALAAWLTAVLIGWQGFLWLRPKGINLRLVIAAAVGLAACITPVTLRACSYTWNHQWPMLLTIVSVLLILRLGARNGVLLAVGAGLAIGVAAGMRISYLPMLAPLGLAVLFLPARTSRQRLMAAAGFSSGALLALLPCIWLFAKAPEDFLFGNFGYPKLSVPRKELPFWGEKTAKTVDPVRGYLGDPKVFKGKKLGEKWKHARSQFFFPNAGVIGLALLAGLPGALWVSRGRMERTFPAIILLGGLPFLIWGCVAPSRFHQQYWYAAVPWLALLALYGLSRLPDSTMWRRVSVGLVVFALAGSALGAVRFSGLFEPPITQFFTVAPGLLPRTLPKDFPPPVLTLHPSTFVAAGARIYPELNSGEFGWRSAHLLPKDRRQRLKLLSPYDLEEILAARPPGVIVIGDPNDELEQPLIRWAERHGYQAGRDLGVYRSGRPLEAAQP